MASKKIAVCLYGLFNNRYSQTAGHQGFGEILQIIRNHPDYDFTFFVYSTDLAEEDAIRHLYEGLGGVVRVEPQRDFESLIENLGVPTWNYSKPGGYRTLGNLLSFLFSRKSSIEMMLADPDHEEFDFVVISRLDAGQIDKHNGRQRAKVSAIGFNAFLDREFVYSAAWDQHNFGYADQWFICSPSNAKVLAMMYEQVQSYLMPDSNYLNFLESGIHDSNASDSFSNERLKKRELKADALATRKQENALDAHLMHKFFFLENGIYEKSKFSSEVEGIALLVYSHSEYFDSLRYFHLSINEHMNFFSKRVLVADAVAGDTFENYVTVIYNEASSYTDRLIEALVKLDDEIVFFNHEDFLLTGSPQLRHFLDAVELVKSGRLDYFNFGIGGYQIGYPLAGRKSVAKYINRASPWIFSLQPSLWNRKKFIDLLSRHRGESIWEFEASAQKTFRKLSLRGGFSRRRGKKRGSLHWDNPFYPYIATAIVKGKWNTSEYPLELEEMFECYGQPDSNRQSNAP